MIKSDWNNTVTVAYYMTHSPSKGSLQKKITFPLRDITFQILAAFMELEYVFGYSTIWLV